MSKAQLRSGWRNSYPKDPGIRQAASESVCKILSQLSALKSASRIGVFCGLPWELNLQQFYEGRVENCVFPKVLHKSSGAMGFFKIESLSDLAEGYAGIWEPRQGCGEPVVGWSEDDIILVPGFAFDEQGSRVGTGKGYYDRYLAKNPAQHWGVCYEQQVISTPLPQAEFDIRMTAIITERGFRDLSKG